MRHAYISNYCDSGLNVGGKECSWCPCIELPSHSLQCPQLVIQYTVLGYSLLRNVFQCCQIGYMFFTFVVLGRNEDTAHGKHLPLEARKLFCGLDAVQVAHRCVCCCDVQMEVGAYIHHPFGDDFSILEIGGIKCAIVVFTLFPKR